MNPSQSRTNSRTPTTAATPTAFIYKTVKYAPGRLKKNEGNGENYLSFYFFLISWNDWNM